MRHHPREKDKKFLSSRGAEIGRLRSQDQKVDIWIMVGKHYAQKPTGIGRPLEGLLLEIELQDIFFDLPV